MAKTTSIFARVEPEIKEQAEMVLNKLGIPMSSAVNIFLRQVVIQNGLPFDVKIKQNKPVAFEDLTTEEFNNEIEKGFNDLKAGRVLSAEKVAERITKEYGHEL
ncbi:type II toxin-antitoxin system RelB/DinJ family antitoxin [Tindallia californiensis]|uniref:Addiction module antitoxin, RelB/DinJ family n=1 Tax=Tindallia californiensis TaxID=159292 RepID=A0A1H3JZ16_9FIRM|nr:type II toxin-antitoxin system RelB/DinJ family antitoxin [Tindallia californiensis]SDY45162.1 addiction module antitoxin, RelB/DinJ family [Tindallia californiensis]